MKGFELSDDLRLKIITGGNSKSVQDSFTEWVEETYMNNPNSVIIKDIKCTECDDDYTIFIFYKAERWAD